jgi:hypothetical protein
MLDAVNKCENRHYWDKPSKNEPMTFLDINTGYRYSDYDKKRLGPPKTLVEARNRK